MIAARYATALFELAGEENRIDEYQSQMRLVQKTIKNSPDLLAFLTHCLIFKEDKKQVLSKIFAHSVNVSALKFLYLLVEKDRIALVNKILKEFDRLCNQSKNICSGIVYSAYPLSVQQIDAIEEAIKSRLGTRVELDNQIDETLISGVKVVVNDNVIDGSLKHKINALRENLLSKGGMK